MKKRLVTKLIAGILSTTMIMSTGMIACAEVVYDQEAVSGDHGHTEYNSDGENEAHAGDKVVSVTADSSAGDSYTHGESITSNYDGTEITIKNTDITSGMSNVSFWGSDNGGVIDNGSGPSDKDIVGKSKDTTVKVEGENHIRQVSVEMTSDITLTVDVAKDASLSVDEMSVVDNVNLTTSSNTKFTYERKESSEGLTTFFKALFSYIGGSGSGSSSKKHSDKSSSSAVTNYVKNVEKVTKSLQESGTITSDKGMTFKSKSIVSLSSDVFKEFANVPNGKLRLEFVHNGQAYCVVLTSDQIALLDPTMDYYGFAYIGSVVGYEQLTPEEEASIMNMTDDVVVE